MGRAINNFGFTCSGHWNVDVKKVFCPTCSPPNHCSTCPKGCRAAVEIPEPQHVVVAPHPASIENPPSPDESKNYLELSFAERRRRERVSEVMKERWERYRVMKSNEKSQPGEAEPEKSREIHSSKDM